MPISDENSLIFVSIPKTFGSEIADSLQMNEMNDSFKWYSYKNRAPTKWRKYYSFSVVRNPFERIVKNFKDARNGDSYWDTAISPTKLKHGSGLGTLEDKSFREMISLLDELEHEGWEGQYTYVTNGTGDLVVDKIVKLENINEGLNRFLEKIGCSKSVDIKPESESLKYRNYYDKETKEKVKKKYKKDLDFFDYSF